MRKNFLLVFLLALLPMAGWASVENTTPTVEWKGGLATKEFSYTTLPSPNFVSELTVRSAISLANSPASWGTTSETYDCTSQGVGTTYPTANSAQYYYNIYASETSETAIPASDLVAGGSYVLRLYVKYVSKVDATRYNYGGGYYYWVIDDINDYATKTYNLPFTITSKPEVTVKVFAITKEWEYPWTKEPSIDDFNADASLRSVSGATTNWNDVKNYLSFKRVDIGTDVGTYAYTLSNTTHPSYTIHIDDASAKLNITQTTNVFNSTPGATVAAWTYGDEVNDAFDKITVDAKYGKETATFEFFKGSESLGATIPTDAGDYTVVVTVPEPGTKNYTEIVSAPIAFTIDKADPTITITSVGGATGDYAFTYDAPDFDEANIVYTTVSDGAVTYTYTLNGAAVTAFDGSAGEWTVTANLAEGTNWNAATSAAFAFKVDKAEAGAIALTAAEGLNFQYDQATNKAVKQDLITAGTSAGATVMYSLDGTTWSDAFPQGDHAKTYTVYYYAKGDANHKDIGKASKEEAAGSVDVSIAKIDFVLASTPTAATGLVFNAADQSLLASGIARDKAKCPQGVVTYFIDGDDTKPIDGSAFANVKAMDAGTYTITWTVSAAGEFADDYNPAVTAAGDEVEATIDQFTLYVGGNEVKGTIEDVYDLENEKPLISNSAFLNVDKIKTQFPAADADGIANAAAILDQLVAPVQTLDEIFANAKVATNTVALKKVDVAPAPGAPMNYKIDEPTLLSNAASLTITAKEAAIQAVPVGKDDLAYTGENQALVKTAATGYKANGGAGVDPEKAKAIGKVVYSLTGEDGTWTEDITSIADDGIVGKDAGEYEVFYKAELSTEATSYDRFYEYTAGVKSINVTIAQAANAITNLALEGWTYGEEANTPVADATFKAEGEPTFTYSDSETGTFTAEVPTNAGTWYVKASVAETTNWAAAEKTIPFQIDQAVAAIATAPAAKTLTYNRKAQALVEAGVSEDGTVMYSLTGEAADFAEAIPTGTDAGIYNVYYMVKGDANHTDFVAEAPVEVTIAKADVTDIVKPAEINPNYTLTYNGYDQALVKPATFGDEFVKGEFKYFVGKTAPDADSEDWSADIPQAKNAGEYIVHTLFIPNDNHNEADVEPVTVTINKATVGYSLSNLEKPWDGELFGEEEISKLFTLSAGGDGTKLFGDDEYDKPFTLKLPEDYRDAGTYTFKQPKVEFKKDYPENYNVTFNGTAEVIINKVNLVEGEGKDYTAPGAIGGLGYIPEAKQNLVTDGSLISKYAEDYPNKDLAGLPYGGTILFATAEDGEYSEDVPTGTEAKDYEVWFKVAGDINHNETKPVKIKNTIATALLTADFLPEEYVTELPYKAAAYEPTDFIPALDGIDLNEGYEVYAEGELKDAGEYVIMFQGINNYAGEDSKFEVTVKITPIDVIATAPKGVTKVYDGTASLEDIVKNEDIKFYGNLDAVALPTDLALSTEGITVGTYAIKVDAAAINDVNKNYNILDESIDGEVEITPAAAIKVGFDEIPTWTKKFGEDDPEQLTGYTVKATEGEIFADDALLIGAATTAERVEGENVGEYAVTLTIDKTAEVLANYAGVEFDGTAATFEITKNDKTYTVSLANMGKVYDGVELAKDSVIVFTAEDLVIAGYEGDLDKFFVDEEGNATLPTAKLAAAAKDAGEYTINLEGAQELSLNYNFSLVPATYTIEKFNVTEATIDPQKVQKGKELDVTAFTITAPAVDAEKFYVTAPDLVDLDDIVTGDAGVYPKGLVIAVDASVAKNYTGLDAFTAELEIIAADAIILADNEDCKPEAQDGVDVTFASRKLNAGTWNVVALPFAVSVPEISDAFGYAAVDILDQTNANPKEIHFKVISSYIDSEDKKIPAYTPFIVKTTEDDGYKKTDFDQVVFHNVNIEAGDGENKSVEDAAGNKFWGTFQAETKIWGEKFRYMSKGAWYDATNYTESKPAKIGAFRGYIEMVEAGARIFIEEPDGTVTAIDAVSFNKQAAEGMYNLNGVKVNNLNRKGVYIKNGVKVIK